MFNRSKDDIFHAFMFIYLKELEQDTNLLQKLEQVIFHLDEANSDKEAKQAIKEHMLNNCRLNSSKYLVVSNDAQQFRYQNLENIYIKNVFLPNELTSEIKQYIRKSKPTSVYTNPDLLIELTNRTKCSIYLSIELKSTKNNNIPGSSVQQINPFEWVIFIKQGKPIKIVTGLYINSITEKIQFPDRSPRPQVAFNTLLSWNRENISLDDDKYNLKISSNELKNKNQLIENWKLFLVKNWLNFITDKNLILNQCSPWFNETLVIYTKEIIDYYKNLNKKDKQDFYEKLASMLNQDKE